MSSSVRLVLKVEASYNGTAQVDRAFGWLTSSQTHIEMVGTSKGEDRTQKRAGKKVSIKSKITVKSTRVSVQNRSGLARLSQRDLSGPG